MKVKVLLIALVIALALDAFAHRPLRNYRPGEISHVYINPNECHDGATFDYYCNNVHFVPQTLDARSANGR